MSGILNSRNLINHPLSKWNVKKKQSQAKSFCIVDGFKGMIHYTWTIKMTVFTSGALVMKKIEIKYVIELW